MPENNFIYQDHFILATPPEVQHDTSLSGNGTVNSPLGVVPGYNETVIFDGDIYYNTTGLLSEPITNFERVRIINKPGQYVETYTNWSGADTPNTFVALYTRYDLGAQGVKYMGVGLSANGTTMKEMYNRVVAIPPTANVWSNVNDGETHIYKIIGINRKQ